jgi:hypothetical protein
VPDPEPTVVREVERDEGVLVDDPTVFEVPD